MGSVNFTPSLLSELSLVQTTVQRGAVWIQCGNNTNCTGRKELQITMYDTKGWFPWQIQLQSEKKPTQHSTLCSPVAVVSFLIYAHSGFTPPPSVIYCCLSFLMYCICSSIALLTQPCPLTDAMPSNSWGGFTGEMCVSLYLRRYRNAPLTPHLSPPLQHKQRSIVNLKRRLQKNENDTGRKGVECRSPPPPSFHSNLLKIGWTSRHSRQLQPSDLHLLAGNLFVMPRTKAQLWFWQYTIK